MRSSLVIILALHLVTGCREPSARPTTAPGGHASPTPTDPVARWEVPAGWRGETIPFPLAFAPAIYHRGVEELRFAPGFFEPKAPGYWAYAFVWRTDDAASLDAAALGAELTDYFRGLTDAVDRAKRIAGREEILVRAVAVGVDRYELRAHVFDAFTTAAALDLAGWAHRRACGDGALWTFVLAPASSALRLELDALARTAACGQPAM